MGFVIPVAGKQGVFVIGLGTTLTKLQWNLNEKSHQVTRLITVDADKPGNRWNDGKADINGYLWAGKCTYFIFSFIIIYSFIRVFIIYS